MVTLDTWVTGWRPRDLAASNFPQLRGHCLANYTSDPVVRDRLGQDPDRDLAATVGQFVQLFGNPLTWDDLPWLRSLTTVPLSVKGICHPDDARRAKDGGSTGSTVPTTAAGRPTAGCPRSTACPPWWRRPAACRSSSTPASSPAPT